MIKIRAEYVAPPVPQGEIVVRLSVQQAERVMKGIGSATKKASGLGTPAGVFPTLTALREAIKDALEEVAS